jgi:hypothetical protein
MIIAGTAAFVATQSDLAKRIEQAMSGAALQATAEGVTDPNEIRRRMLDARERVKCS